MQQKAEKMIQRDAPFLCMIVLKYAFSYSDLSVSLWYLFLKKPTQDNFERQMWVIILLCDTMQS